MGEAESSSPPVPSEPGRDAPLEAIVLSAPPVRGECPFAAEPAPFQRAQAPQWYAPLPPPKTYVVPKRFGLLAILAITTVMGMLFGGLRFLDAPPAVFLFLGLMALAICLVQMFYGRVPRMASIVTGAILTPMIVVPMAVYHGGHVGLVICSAVMWVLLGGCVGYLTGTCAAGIFLILEQLEPHLPGRRNPDAASSDSIWGDVPGGSHERRST